MPFNFGPASCSLGTSKQLARGHLAPPGGRSFPATCCAQIGLSLHKLELNETTALESCQLAGLFCCSRRSEFISRGGCRPGFGDGGSCSNCTNCKQTYIVGPGEQAGTSPTLSQGSQMSHFVFLTVKQPIALPALTLFDLVAARRHR